MPFVFWDASRLIKRYVSEAGAATVDAVFAQVTPAEMVMTPWGYLEIYAILRRRFHSGLLNHAALVSTQTALQNEVLNGVFNLISISDNAIFAASSLIDRHHVNSADAAILSAYLRFPRQLPLNRSSCLLVAADKRLLRAAEAEGLKTLNPEMVSASMVPAFLAAL